MVVGGFAIAIMGIMFTIFIVLFVLLPLIALKVHLVTTVEFENNYNNAQLGLLTFLSSTETVGGEIQPVSEILANHIALNNPSDVSFLSGKLSKLFCCYKLSDEKSVLLKSSCEPSHATAKAEIALPYGEYKSILTLVID